MHALEIGLVGHLRFRRNSKHLPAALGELQFARARKKIERPDVRRFGGELETLAAFPQFRFAFARERFLFFSLGDVRAKNHDSVLRFIHPRLDPALPWRVKEFAMARFARAHDPERFLVELGADCFRKNFPDHAADHFFPGPAGHLSDEIVHVSVTPVAVQRRKGLADAGQKGVAFLDQIAHFKVAPARAQGGAHGTDESEIAQWPGEEQDIGACAGQFPNPSRHFGRPCRHQQRQVRPLRLFAQPLHQLSRRRVCERFFRQDDSARLIVEVHREMIELLKEFRSNSALGQRIGHQFFFALVWKKNEDGTTRFLRRPRC